MKKRKGKYRKAAESLVNQVDLCMLREKRCDCVRFAEMMLKNLVTELSKTVVH